MPEIGTGGHGYTKGLSKINDHLKQYFRGKKDPHQNRMDRAWARSGKHASEWHGKALNTRSYIPEWLRD